MESYFIKLATDNEKNLLNNEYNNIKFYNITRVNKEEAKKILSNAQDFIRSHLYDIRKYIKALKTVNNINININRFETIIKDSYNGNIINEQNILEQVKKWRTLFNTGKDIIEKLIEFEEAENNIANTISLERGKINSILDDSFIDIYNIPQLR